MTDQSLTYREQVLLNVAQDNGLFPFEAKVLPTIVDAICRKMGMSESDTLWHLATNKELASYASGIARDCGIVSE
jgi:hypothetical protein